MFGSDGSPIVQYVVIFAVIFTALAAIVFTVRRLTGRNVALPGRGGGRGRQPRLGIVDVYELDRARQLILLRRDNVEHLLLVGGPNDVVVERNIQRVQRPLPEASLRGDAGADALDEPLPDPLVQGGRLPEPPRALPEMAGRRAEPLFDPGFEMPVIVPPPVPRSAAGPSLTLPLDPALLAGDEPGQDVAAPLSPPPPVAAPPAAPVREPAAPRRILSRTAPPLVDPRPAPVSERLPEAVLAAEPAARPAPSLAVPADRRTVDPAILSDMARQLQAALSRPTSAVTPAPVTPAPVAPSPLAPPPPDPFATPDGVAPLAVAMAPPQPVAPSEPVPTVATPAPPIPPVAVPAAQQKPPPPPVAPPAFRPPPAPLPVPPAPKPEAKSSGNPFSVEEIEAEFARLLGRPLDKQG